MTEPTDIAAEFHRRNRRAWRALFVGAACFGIALLCSWIAGGAEPSGSFSALSALNILCLLATPGAFGVAAANLSTSDSLALRILYAIAAGVVVLVAVLYVTFKMWVAGGGVMHM
jgi:hypothetical protein